LTAFVEIIELKDRTLDYISSEIGTAVYGIRDEEVVLRTFSQGTIAKQATAIIDLSIALIVDSVSICAACFFAGR
jgi:hypothetical protein